MLKTKIEIESWLDTMQIKDYKVNDDLSVKVDADVNLANKGLTSLPVQFSNVIGTFSIRSNYLTSLLGCPQVVVGSFDCDRNQLTTLEHGPTTVKDRYSCEENKLVSLIGAPECAHDDFYCGHNFLKSLKGVPKEILGSLDARDNKIEHLQFLPEFIEGRLNLMKNKFTGFEPNQCEVGRDIMLGYNQITSLSNACKFGQHLSLEQDFIIEEFKEFYNGRKLEITYKELSATLLYHELNESIKDKAASSKQVKI